MKRRFIAGLVGVVVVLLAVGARLSAPESSGVETTSVPHFQSADVQVRITEEAQVSRGEQPYLVQLEQGVIPADVTHLEVLTDENCQPDADGVSHCLNRVRFMSADGPGQAALRHHHRMSEEPCLSPGQTLELVG